MENSGKLDSLTIFFPFYNDAGTIEKQINDAFNIGGTLTNNLEVIAMHGGNSKDDTFEKIKEMKAKYPMLVVVDKGDNWEGYAVIKYGFEAASKEWVFYTDGDAQYHLDDLPKLVRAQVETCADVVNGYKRRRGDSFTRTLLGDIYAKFSNFIFELPVRDTDCDFRLIKRSLFDKFDLESHDSSILAEMLKKLELSGAKFTEVPVYHYRREYGDSNYKPSDLLKEKLIGDIKLYLKIRNMPGGKSALRIIKFGGIGVTSIIIQNILFNICIIAFRISPAPAAILADQIAIISSFILNNRITFNDRKLVKPAHLIPAFIKFYTIIMVSTLIQAFIVFTGTKIFGESLITSNFFFGVGVIVTFFWNYKMQKRLVWAYNSLTTHKTDRAQSNH